MQHWAEERSLAPYAVLDVLSLICNHLDSPDLFTLRSVCKDLRTVVDQHRPWCFKQNFILYMEHGNEMTMFPRDSSFFQHQVLPRLRFHFHTNEVPDTVMHDMCVLSPAKRPLHVCLNADLYAAYPLSQLEPLVNRIERVHIQVDVITPLTISVLQNIPNLEFTECCFDLDDLTCLARSKVQSFLMHKSCYKKDKSNGPYITMVPTPTMSVDLSVVKLVCPPSMERRGNWLFHVDANDISESNFEFLQRVTGRLQLLWKGAFWGERIAATPRMHFPALSCTSLHLSTIARVFCTFGICSTVEKLYATNIHFVLDPGCMPSVRELYVSNCFFTPSNFSLQFPNLERLEMHSTSQHYRALEISHMQQLHTLLVVVERNHPTVLVRNNPILTSFSGNCESDIVFMDNPSLEHMHCLEHNANGPHSRDSHQPVLDPQAGEDGEGMTMDDFAWLLRAHKDWDVSNSEEDTHTADFSAFC